MKTLVNGRLDQNLRHPQLVQFENTPMSCFAKLPTGPKLGRAAAWKWASQIASPCCSKRFNHSAAPNGSPPNPKRAAACLRCVHPLPRGPKPGETNQKVLFLVIGMGRRNREQQPTNGASSSFWGGDPHNGGIPFGCLYTPKNHGLTTHTNEPRSQASWGTSKQRRWYSTMIMLDLEKQDGQVC